MTGKLKLVISGLIVLIVLIVVTGVHCTVTATAAMAMNNTPSPVVNTTKPTATSPPKPIIIPTGSINGTVYDSLNNLVPDADVYLKDGSGTVMGLTITDRNGSYVYTELEPGNYTIVVQTDGYMWIAKPFVNVGNSTVANVYIPYYVHWPAVTPWPTPVTRVNNTTSTGTQKGGAVKATATPTSTTTNTTAGNTTAANSTKSGLNVTTNSTASSENMTQNSTSEEGSGDIFSGIIGFFKSLFGM